MKRLLFIAACMATLGAVRAKAAVDGGLKQRDIVSGTVRPALALSGSGPSVAVEFFVYLPPTGGWMICESRVFNTGSGPTIAVADPACVKLSGPNGVTRYTTERSEFQGGPDLRLDPATVLEVGQGLIRRSIRNKPPAGMFSVEVTYDKRMNVKDGVAGSIRFPPPQPSSNADGRAAARDTMAAIVGTPVTDEGRLQPWIRTTHREGGWECELGIINYGAPREVPFFPISLSISEVGKSRDRLLFKSDKNRSTHVERYDGVFRRIPIMASHLVPGKYALHANLGKIGDESHDLHAEFVVDSPAVDGGRQPGSE